MYWKNGKSNGNYYGVIGVIIPMLSLSSNLEMLYGVTFWIPIKIRHLIFRVPKKGP